MKKAVDLERVKSSVAEIEVAAENLTVSLNNLLDMSRIESGSFVLEQETFYLKRLASEVVEGYRDFCDEKGIGLICEMGDLDEDWLIISDKKRLRQILANAVGTMVRLSRDGHVLLLMSVGVEDNVLKAYFSVSDNNSAIIADHVRELLELSEKEDIGAGLIGGTDLSMVIVKNLVRRMGGEINVESVQEGGVRLAFSVLLAEADRDEAGKDVAIVDPALPGTASFDKKVLFCDDVEINRMIFAELFMDTAMIIDEAEDGMQAISYFANSPKDYYDIIFMDVKMPGISGYEAVRRIRNLECEDAKGVPVVMMMTSENQEETKIAEALGATDHLIKPADINAVRRMLSKHVR
ncbi:hypothetical protein FACS1894127_5390 [Clostridia bacterium]|nr:hypothetical protein FACS1894127_5390 [Clostridia bacterium]